MAIISPLPSIILASSSRYRAQCLHKICPHFEIFSPNIDETPQMDENAYNLALRLSEEKAKYTAKQLTNTPHLVIASDQAASCNHKILNKPGSFENAKEQLLEQSGKSIAFHTGLCLINTQNGQIKSAVETFTVKFKQLNPQQIENYLQKEQPFDCAGSFKSEGLGIALFEEMAGRDPNTLIGLPLMLLSEWLTNEGLDPLLQ